MKRTDRSALIRLAASLPRGSGERRAILAGLEKAAAETMWVGWTDIENGDEVVEDGKVIGKVVSQDVRSSVNWVVLDTGKAIQVWRHGPGGSLEVIRR